MRWQPGVASTAPIASTALVLAVGLLAAASAVAAAAERAAHKTHTVTIENVQYGDRSLSVQRGDRIVWINKDLVPHTVSADSGVFDSGDLPAGARWAYTAKAPGTFGYHCRYHPTMVAQLIVQAGQTP